MVLTQCRGHKSKLGTNRSVKMGQKCCSAVTVCVCTYTGVSPLPQTHSWGWAQQLSQSTALFLAGKCGWQQQLLPPHQQGSPLFTTNLPAVTPSLPNCTFQGKTLTALLCRLYTRLFPYSASSPLSLPGFFWGRAVKCLPTFSPSLPLDSNFPSRGDCRGFICWL